MNTEGDDAVAAVCKPIVDEQTELERQLPLHNTRRARKRVPKALLWNRAQREEMSKMAEVFLSNRKGGENGETNR